MSHQFDSLVSKNVSIRVFAIFSVKRTRNLNEKSIKKSAKNSGKKTLSSTTHSHFAFRKSRLRTGIVATTAMMTTMILIRVVAAQTMDLMMAIVVRQS